MLDRVIPVTPNLQHGSDLRLGAANTLGEAVRSGVRVFAWTSGCMVLVLIIAILHLATAKRQFTGQTQLLIDARQPHVVQVGEARMLLDRSEIDSQIALIRSEHIALMVLRKLGMLPDSAQDLNQHGNLGAQRIRKAISNFQRQLDVRRLGVSYVIEIFYTASSPETAATVSNATAEAYIEDQLAARGNAVRQGSQWLEQRIEDLRLQMNAAAMKMQEFKARRDYRIVSKPEGDGSSASTPQLTPAPPAATLEELESTAQNYRKIYESYLQAFTESVIRQSYPVANARIIGRASPPMVTTHPSATRWLVLACAIGALLGLGMGLVWEGARFLISTNSSAMNILTSQVRVVAGRLRKWPQNSFQALAGRLSSESRSSK